MNTASETCTRLSQSFRAFMGKSRSIIPQKEKLDFLGILIKAFRTSSKNFYFFILIFLTSIPLLCLLIYDETTLQKTLIQTWRILSQSRYPDSENWPFPLCLTRNITKDYVNNVFQLAVLRLVPLHLLHLCSRVLLISSAWKLYKEENSSSLRELMHVPNYKERLKRAFITSNYVLFFSTCMVLGSIWLVSVYYVIMGNFTKSILVSTVYRFACMVLLAKSLELSAICNMSIVISTMEEVSYGAKALVLSYRINEGGNKQTNVVLVVVFLVWEIACRFPCVYAGCWGMIVLRVGLLYLGEIVKWFAFVIHFHECGSRVMMKIDDDEEREFGAAISSPICSERI